MHGQHGNQTRFALREYCSSVHDSWYGRLVWGEGRFRRMLQDSGILNIRALLQYAAFVRCP